jgi:hypothetical protein
MRHEVIGLDLTDSRAPTVRWRYVADAQSVVLSPDARRFAVANRIDVQGVEIYDADSAGSALRLLLPQASVPQLASLPMGSG